MSGYEALTLLDVSSNQLQGSMPTGVCVWAGRGGCWQ